MTEPHIERLVKFLSKRNGNAGSVTIHDYTPITGGYSRAMSRFWAEDANGRFGYVMRADPPPGQSILDTDRAYEWALLRSLYDTGTVRIPEPLWFDPIGDELGSPAFISRNLECDSLFVVAQGGTADSNRDLLDPLALIIADVHTFDMARLPAGVERPASWEAYMDSCIQKWRTVEATHCEREPFVRVAAAWLDANRPAPAPLGLVHGDFQGPNVLIEKGTGTFHMIDWELGHIGDPREDLGWWALAHLSQPPDIIGQNMESFLAKYRAATGLSEEAVNPQSVAYFTVMASANVYFNLMNMTNKIANGEKAGTSAAYMTNAMPFMHNTWITSMQAAGLWNKGNAA